MHGMHVVSYFKAMLSNTLDHKFNIPRAITDVSMHGYKLIDVIEATSHFTH